MAGQEFDEVEFPRDSGNVLRVPRSERGEDAPPPTPRARLAVVEMVYWQDADGSMPAPPSERRFTRWLQSTEAPYLRGRFKVSKEWTKLDTGWLNTDVGMLVLWNEPTVFQTQPTPEQREEAAAKVIEIGVTPDDVDWSPHTFALLRPGENCRFEPWLVGQLRVRCQKGDARLSIAALPK